MNIVEGNAKRTKKDQLKFLTIAEASLEELHYQFLLAIELRYFTPENIAQIFSSIESVSILLQKFRAGIQLRKMK